MNETFLRRQIRTISGDEIVCEVIQWHDEDDFELIVRAAMKLVQSTKNDTKIYSFRPYMVYVENPEDLLVLNAHNIECIAVPSEPLLYQYDLAVDEMYRQYIQRMEDYELVRPSHESVQPKEEVEKEDAKVIDLFSGKTVH